MLFMPLGAVLLAAFVALRLDALSTAFSVMKFADVRVVARRLDAEAYFTLPDGARVSA